MGQAAFRVVVAGEGLKGLLPPPEPPEGVAQAQVAPRVRFRPGPVVGKGLLVAPQAVEGLGAEVGPFPLGEGL